MIYPTVVELTSGSHPNEPRIDVLETMRAELDECVALLRLHYPDKDDDELRQRAMCLRPKAYETGRWPSAEEIAAEKAMFEAAEAAKVRGSRSPLDPSDEIPFQP